LLAHPTRFERVTFAFGGATVRNRTPRRSSYTDFAATDPPWRAVFHLETAANLLELLERLFSLFSKCALKSLNNQTDFDSAIRRFDPSRPSQPFLLSARLPKKSENGPEIPPFRAFDFVSGLPLCGTSAGNRQKSPAFYADIPVLRRLSAETGLITTVARGRQSISCTDKVSNKSL
jgi:hypothetical protein